MAIIISLIASLQFGWATTTVTLTACMDSFGSRGRGVRKWVIVLAGLSLFAA
jgi:hypothetical protein